MLLTNASATRFASAWLPIMSEQSTAMPAGRLRRTAKVGGLLGGEVAKAYATKAANLVRSEDDRSAANERRRLEAADHIVEMGPGDRIFEAPQHEYTKSLLGAVLRPDPRGRASDRDARAEDTVH